MQQPKEFTQEQFDTFIEETIPQSLFSVMPTDIDDETGVRCDEIILLRLLNQHPEALRYKSLASFVQDFITNCE